MKIGDKVEILTTISLLQPKIYKDESIKLIKKTYPQYGTIMGINGGYVYVKPKNRTWEIDCYGNELRVISDEEFKLVKNYYRKDR